MKKRILGILTSLALAVSVMAVGAVPAFAAPSDPVLFKAIAGVEATKASHGGANFTATKVGSTANKYNIITAIGATADTVDELAVEWDADTSTLTINWPDKVDNAFDADKAKKTLVNTAIATAMGGTGLIEVTDDVTSGTTAATASLAGGTPTVSIYGAAGVASPSKLTVGKTKIYNVVVGADGEDNQVGTTAYSWTSDTAGTATVAPADKITATLTAVGASGATTSLKCEVTLFGVPTAIGVNETVTLEDPAVASVAVSGPTSAKKGSTNATYAALAFDQDGDAMAPAIAASSFTWGVEAAAGDSGNATGASVANTGVLTVGTTLTAKKIVVTATNNGKKGTSADITIGGGGQPNPSNPNNSSDASGLITGNKGTITPIKLDSISGTKVGDVGVTIEMGQLSSKMRKDLEALGDDKVEKEVNKVIAVAKTLEKKTAEKAAVDMIDKVKALSSKPTITPINLDGTNHTNFAFPVTLTAKLGLKNAASSYLYYCDTANKVTSFVDEFTTNGDVTSFTITHASDYFFSNVKLNLSDPALGEGVTETEAPIVSDVTTVTEAPAPVEPVNPPTGNVAPIALLVCAVAAAGVVIVKRK